MKTLAFAVRPDEMSAFRTFQKELGHDVTLTEQPFGPSSAILAEGYEAVSILGNCNANAKAIELIARLGVKYLATRSAGINNIDMDAARKYGIRVSNVPAYSPNSVAEFTVLATLCLARNLHQALSRVRQQNFGLQGLLGFELREKTIGFIGTGRIGVATMKAFSGFGARLIGYSSSERNEAKQYIEYKSLDKLYEEADIISLHCPQTEDNYHMIDADAIEKMKQGVILVNTARGGLVDMEAIIDGLKSGKIGGMATDVYEHEAGIFHKDHSANILYDDTLARLIQFPNVVVTPHYGFYTDQAVANMVEFSLQNLKDFEENHHCENEIR